MSRRILLPLLVALALASPIAALAGGGKMTSSKLGPKLCETHGGGKFVDIPGFPGEKIDRRLLRDVKRLVKRYKIFVTDGYSLSDVHSWNGEHPIGLALDIVPNTAAGGSWKDIDKLAKWAEPRQNQPRPPFRWVGYNGDSNHGRGHHLHLSWNHSMTKPGRPASSVFTIRCPGGRDGAPAPPIEPDPPVEKPDRKDPKPEPEKDRKPPRPEPTGGVGGSKPVHESGGVSAP